MVYKCAKCGLMWDNIRKCDCPIEKPAPSPQPDAAGDADKELREYFWSRDDECKALRDENESLKSNLFIARKQIEDNDILIWQLRGALGYPVPMHIRENPKIRNGIAEIISRDLASARATVERVRALADRIEAEPLATGGHAETGQLGRLQVVDEIRSAIDVPETKPDLCPTCQMLRPMHQMGCPKAPQPDTAVMECGNPESMAIPVVTGGGSHCCICRTRETEARELLKAAAETLEWTWDELDPIEGDAENNPETIESEKNVYRRIMAWLDGGKEEG